MALALLVKDMALLVLALAIGGLTLHVRALRSCSKRTLSILSTLQYSIFWYE